MEFHCVEECAQCCIEREYYPSKEFGKIGVLILPEEKEKIEKLSKIHHKKTRVIPRIGVSEDKTGPKKILAYQLMGIEKNGNTCPFLDIEGKNLSPHGGFSCKIYENRPLACRAYPLIESKPMILDEKCKFCKEHGHTEKNLNSETEALLKIKEKMDEDYSFVWRYATNTGNPEDSKILKSGWILEDS